QRRTGVGAAGQRRGVPPALVDRPGGGARRARRRRQRLQLLRAPGAALRRARGGRTLRRQPRPLHPEERSERRREVTFSRSTGSAAAALLLLVSSVPARADRTLRLEEALAMALEHDESILIQREALAA